MSIVSYFLFAQESLDEEVIVRIKAEGFQKSRVMETLVYMSDIYGPRLSGSPDFREAADWAKKKGLRSLDFRMCTLILMPMTCVVGALIHTLLK
jgi:hypothetical protein